MQSGVGFVVAAMGRLVIHKGRQYLMVLLMAVGALDVVSNKVPASNDLADQEERIGLSSDQSSLQVLVLGDVLPCVGRAGRLDKLDGGILGSLNLGTRGRGHTLADVDLLGNLTSNLGVVKDRAYSLCVQSPLTTLLGKYEKKGCTLLSRSSCRSN